MINGIKRPVFDMKAEIKAKKMDEDDEIIRSQQRC